ncbi:MAG: sulfotransferase [Gammaproteobacteria bacterium]|nr:sulfotransferase [Gammaproteobacteria bacterium]
MNEGQYNAHSFRDKLDVLLGNLTKFQDQQLFFLGGFIKSGTTWIERLLDTHPQVACKGEAHFASLLEPALRSAIVKYNSVIPERGNWKRLNDEGVESTQTSDYSYLEQDFDNISRLSIQLLMSKWSGNSSIRAVGEKTPNNAQYFYRFHQLFPNAKFIYIVRDIRDVIVSGWFFNLALDSEGTISKYSTIHDYGTLIIKNWIQEIANANNFIEQHNNQAMLIRYEDLWSEPQLHTKRLLQFLGVEDSDESIEFCLEKTDFSKLSGGRTRGTENRGSFYRKGIIGDWKNHLKHDTLVEVELYCGAMLDHLGYDQYLP